MTDFQMRVLQERFARILREYTYDDIAVSHMAQQMAESTKVAAQEWKAEIARRQCCTLPSRLN